MKRFKANGESNKQLMEIVVNEIRENRNDIKEVRDILREGEGKIASNRATINTMKWGLGIASGAILTLISCIIGGIL